MTDIETLERLEETPHQNVFPGSEPRTIRLALSDGESVPPHTHPDRDVVFYLLEGRVELTLGDTVGHTHVNSFATPGWRNRSRNYVRQYETTHELSAGQIARFEGEQEISPEGTEDSVALIVLAKRSAG